MTTLDDRLRELLACSATSRLPVQPGPSKELFKKACSIKNDYQKELRQHELWYLVELCQAASLFILIGAESDRLEELMAFIRQVPMGLSEGENGGYRDIYEIDAKLTDEIIRHCDTALAANRDRVIQPYDGPTVMEGKMNGHFEVNLHYSLLRWFKGVVFGRRLRLSPHAASSERDRWFREAYVEFFTAQRGFIYTNERDKDRPDFRDYMIVFDTC